MHIGRDTQTHIIVSIAKGKTMNNATVISALAEIEKQLNILKAELNVAPNDSDKIVIKSSYTAEEAIAEKIRINQAFQDGNITYDKRRGLKMLVTKATAGWSPVKTAVA